MTDFGKISMKDIYKRSLKSTSQIPIKFYTKLGKTELLIAFDRGTIST